MHYLDFEPTGHCSYSLELFAANSNFIVLDFNQSGIELTIHHTRWEHVQHYTTVKQKIPCNQIISKIIERNKIDTHKAQINDHAYLLQIPPNEDNWWVILPLVYLLCHMSSTFHYSLTGSIVKEFILIPQKKFPSCRLNIFWLTEKHSLNLIYRYC